MTEMSKTLQTRQEREWFRRNQITKYYHKVYESSSNQAVMSIPPNLWIVPLFVNHCDELVSTRYDNDLNTLYMGTQTKFDTISEVTYVKMKKGYVVCLMSKGVCYIHYPSNKKTYLVFENNDDVLLDGLWDTCTNTCVTVTCDVRQTYIVRRNETIVQRIQHKDMIDMVSLCGNRVTWDTIESSHKIYEVNFLSCIGRWLIESAKFIYILDGDGYRQFMDDKAGVTNAMLNEKHNFDGMIYDYDGNEIYLSTIQDVVMYQKNGHLFVAQTLHPFHIKHLYFTDYVPRIHRWYDHIGMHETILQTTSGTYKLSMYPKSLTASTSIDTTLE